ncbi:hypothetical protein E4U43_002348 [Claviceps pusilla]|uniref:Uncharacterized protein n=1 Tax=Claviceps pusilla TaxID=123648 RepID=A0A9P7N6D2_9HYPO|nr:hypothetical protein E4U43_002348 [Claviceps pusilla]
MLMVEEEEVRLDAGICVLARKHEELEGHWKFCRGPIRGELITVRSESDNEDLGRKQSLAAFCTSGSRLGQANRGEDYFMILSM